MFLLLFFSWVLKIFFLGLNCLTSSYNISFQKMNFLGRIGEFFEASFLFFSLKKKVFLFFFIFQFFFFSVFLENVFLFCFFIYIHAASGICISV